MTMIQVQNEPTSTRVSRTVSGVPLSLLEAVTTDFSVAKKANLAALESMLLGVALRGWLADNEKEFLDNLAPDRSITFLIRSKQYLHPEGIELFPSQLIETAIRQGGEAFFSHRYRPDKCKTDGYTIHTALINPSEPEPMVLGYFGPDSQLGQPENQDRFYRLVSQFRQTYRLVGYFIHDFAGTQKSDIPTIIVNRCSGRVVSTNRAAEKLFRTSQRSLVDQEFGQLKARLGSVSYGHKMKMANICRGNLHLTIITIPSPQTSSESESSTIPEPFVNRILRLSVGLTKATGQLNTLSRKAMNGEITELSHSVVEAADELDFYVTRLHFLLSFDDLASCRIDLREELKQAVQAVILKLGHKRKIEMANEIVGLTVRAPRDAFRHLFESILQSHLSELDVPGRTTISLEKRLSEERPVITIETDTYSTSIENIQNRVWLSFADILAARIGVELTSRQSEDHKLITEMTVNF